MPSWRDGVGATDGYGHPRRYNRSEWPPRADVPEHAHRWRTINHDVGPAHLDRVACEVCGWSKCVRMLIGRKPDGTPVLGYPKDELP